MPRQPGCLRCQQGRSPGLSRAALPGLGRLPHSGGANDVPRTVRGREPRPGPPCRGRGRGRGQAGEAQSPAGVSAHEHEECSQLVDVAALPEEAGATLDGVDHR